MNWSRQTVWPAIIFSYAAAVQMGRQALAAGNATTSSRLWRYPPALGPCLAAPTQHSYGQGVAMLLKLHTNGVYSAGCGRCAPAMYAVCVRAIHCRRFSRTSGQRTESGEKMIITSGSVHLPWNYMGSQLGHRTCLDCTRSAEMRSAGVCPLQSVPCIRMLI